jgi:hypothetical protein
VLVEWRTIKPIGFAKTVEKRDGVAASCMDCDKVKAPIII